MNARTLMDPSSDAAVVEIAGLKVHVRGLTCMATVPSPDLVFVLHGRTQTEADVQVLGTAILARNPGTIVVSFDHRNHGHRLLSDKANATWADGNTHHAQDMFSILYGTSRDVSDLISLLPVYLSRHSAFTFERVFCVGVSLGGHSTYLALSNDPRIDAGVVIIGCPDIGRLMQIRAGDEHEHFLPPSFMDTVEALGASAQRLSSKNVLVLKGNEDMLVPWEASETFLKAVAEDKVTIRGYDKVGHMMTDEMIADAAEWISQIRSRK